MNLADRLSYLASISNTPTFIGWITPIGTNPTQVSGSITLDVISNPRPDQRRLRAYYYSSDGVKCEETFFNLLVLHPDTESESAFLAELP